MSFGSQILIINAVEFFAGLNNTCISDRTIVLLFSNVNVPAELQSAGIEYKDLSIRLLPIFILGMHFGSKILILNAVG